MFLLMKNNFLARFWRGDIKLWISYWLCGVLLQYIVFATDMYISLKFKTPVGIIIFPYAIFWSVGTWRAAQKYTGRALWVKFTELAIVLTAFFIIIALIFALGL